MTHTAYLGLGSNLGDRDRYIAEAKAAITLLGTTTKESSLYDTAPQGRINQPNFLNCVLELQTTLSPRDLLNAILRIENNLGRVRTMLLGPRVIDIDILFYDNQIISEKNLTIPHPNLHKRAFVLIPLLEIAPELKHPLSHKTVAEMLGNLPDQPLIKLASH